MVYISVLYKYFWLAASQAYGGAASSLSQSLRLPEQDFIDSWLKQQTFVSSQSRGWISRPEPAGPCLGRPSPGLTCSLPSRSSGCPQRAQKERHISLLSPLPLPLSSLLAPFSPSSEKPTDSPYDPF